MARFNFRPSAAEPARLVVADPADAPASPPPPAADAAKPMLNLSFEPDHEDKPGASHDDNMLDVRLKLHSKLIEEIDLSKLDKLDEGEMRRQVRRLVGDFARTERLALNASELDELGASVFDEMVGLGPIEPLLKDDLIADILINGPFQVYVERRGELEVAPVRFRDNDHLAAHRPAHRRRGRAADRRVARRWSTRACPTAAASTPPSPRSPSTAPAVSIRKFSKKPFNLERLVEFGAMPAPVAEFLYGAVAQPRLDGDLRRHRLGQDDAAQRPLGGDPQQGAADHHRGRRRAAAAAAARGAHGDPAAEHRGQGRDPPARAGQERAAHAPRPGDPRRGARRGGLRHAAGHEHRPRRLDGHDPRQHPARRRHPPGADGGDGRHAASPTRPSAARSPRRSA